MGGGAWPFLVGGVICLVNSDNERDSSLLTRSLGRTNGAGRGFARIFRPCNKKILKRREVTIGSSDNGGPLLGSADHLRHPSELLRETNGLEPYEIEQ